MSPREAADLAARTLAAIDRHATIAGCCAPDVLDYCRERVASDLAVWNRADGMVQQGHYEHAYYRSEAEAGLRRTARLYGVTE